MGFEKETGRVLGYDDDILTILIPGTGNIYKIREPGGDLAADHFTLMTKGVPTDVTYEEQRVPKFMQPLKEDGSSDEDADPVPVYKTNPDGSIMVDEDGEPIPVMMKIKVPRFSEFDMERLAEAFKAWSKSILKSPGIIVEGLPYNKMPGSDQFGIFMALYEKCNMTSQPFRFLERDEFGGEGSGTKQDK